MTIRRPSRRLLGIALLLVFTTASPARATEVPDEFVDALVAGGLNGPVNFDFLPDAPASRARLVLVARPIPAAGSGASSSVRHCPRVRSASPGTVGTTRAGARLQASTSRT